MKGTNHDSCMEPFFFIPMIHQMNTSQDFTFLRQNRASTSSMPPEMGLSEFHFRLELELCHSWCLAYISSPSKEQENWCTSGLILILSYGGKGKRFELIAISIVEFILIFHPMKTQGVKKSTERLHHE